MKRDSWVFKRKSAMLYLSVIMVWIVILLIQLTFVDQAQVAQFGVSPDLYRIILVVVSTPFLAIWLVLLYAIIGFTNYSENIKDSPDAPGFLNIAYGLSVLLVSSFATSLLSGYSSMATSISSDPLDVQTQIIIATNYLSVISSVLVYWFLLRGGLALLKTVKAKISTKVYLWFVGLPVLIFASLYVALILANPNRYYSGIVGSAPTFGLPDGLIFLTLVLPIVLAWFFAAASIAAYYTFWQKTKGIIYKPLFKNLVIGLAVFIISSIINQIAVQFSSFWASISLDAALLIISVIYLILVFSFWFIGRAAQNLNKIETITLEIEN